MRRPKNFATGRIQLDSRDAPEGAIRLLTDRVDARLLSENRRTVTVTLAREVTFSDAFYGEIELTRKKFQQMIRNFNDNVYGQEIFLDVAHAPSDGAAAKITRLFLDGTKFRAETEFTDFGVDAVTKRGFRYLSIDYTEDYRDPETEKKHGPLLFGAGLTIRPRVKRLDPIELSFDSPRDPIAISPRIHVLFNEEQKDMKELMEKLRKALEAKKLSEAHIKQFTDQFDTVAKQLGDNTAAATAVCDALINAGVQLAEQLAKGAPADVTAIKLDFSGLTIPPSTSGLSEADVRKLLAETQQKAADDARKLQETRDARVKLFTDTFNASEGLKKLSEEQRKTLLAAADFITAETTEDQVKKLATHQITIGNNMAVAAELAGLGYPGAQGSPRITMDESNSIKQLQETIDKRLGLADMPPARRYARTGGQLIAENKAFAEKVLAQFDAEHAAELHRDHKILAGGDGLISDVQVPPSWERTVIREALYNLVGLQFVNADTAAFNVSLGIPFSYRDTTAAGRNNTRTYEGGSIKRAGVIQTSELAYPIPQKISFEVSDEMRYLTGARHINWEAVAENQQNATRIINEDLEQLIHNELLLSSDEYQAVAAGTEDISTQLDGTKNQFVLANFPVVRPRKVFDLKGVQIGNTVNPIVVTYTDDPAAAAAISEYDGTGTQAAGVYYVMDYNLGEIYLVTQAGARVTPANADSLTVSYSYAANVSKFDTDLGANKAEDHWDTFLYKYGLRIAEVKNNRYHMPNFGMMSGSVKTSIEQAKKFAANYQVPGTSLESNGNLGRIKDIPNFDTMAPGIWLGDQRILIGERGNTRLRMMKPWAMNELENQKDANGRFTGKKEAYGDQFLVLHTPSPLKRAMTSMVLYSATGRVARAI